MERKHNPKLEAYAKQLRKSMTPEEKKLWYQFLRKRPETFLRQKIIGNYIVDFYCAQLKLVIEIDGIQHTRLKDRQYDKKRTEFLNSYDLKVIRFSNKTINNHFDMVCDCIKHHITIQIHKLL